MINHPNLGKLVYLKVFLEYSEPELFVCKFVVSDDKYIGKMVEQYMHPTKPDVLIRNYYFVGVNDSEASAAEADFSFLRKLYKTRPVMFLNRATGMGEPVLSWKNEARINPTYDSPEDENHVA